MYNNVSLNSSIYFFCGVVINDQGVVLGTRTFSQGPVQPQGMRHLPQVVLPVGHVGRNVDTLGYSEAKHQGAVRAGQMVAPGAEARSTVAKPAHLKKETREGTCK